MEQRAAVKGNYFWLKGGKWSVMELPAENIGFTTIV
jgi:hypothetical protein